jgi:hypothetical protein
VLSRSAEHCKIIRASKCGWEFTAALSIRVTDVNDKTNIAGSGINVAQRVMDCGDDRHILLSGHVADDLSQYRHWQPYLHDLGECEVKHGLRLHLFNLYKENLDNPQVPEKLKRRGWNRESAAIRRVTPPRWPKFLLIAALFVSTNRPFTEMS